MKIRTLLLAILICVLPTTAFAQDPHAAFEERQGDYFKGFSTEAYDEVLERFEEEKAEERSEDETLSHCPKCETELKKVPIVYGLPGEELSDRAERGEVILGGCLPGEAEFGLLCPECKESQPINEQVEDTQR